MADRFADQVALEGDPEKLRPWTVKSMSVTARDIAIKAARDAKIPTGRWLEWRILEWARLAGQPTGQRSHAVTDGRTDLSVAVHQLALLVEVLTVADQSGTPQVLEAMATLTRDRLRELALRLSRLTPDDPPVFAPPPVPTLPRASPGRFIPRLVSPRPVKKRAKR